MAAGKRRVFTINEWFERYEVNAKGQPAKEGDSLRVRPLDYIRSKVHGRDEGAGFHAMRCKARARTWEVFGMFQKFLEIAGKSGPQDRGKLLNQQGGPATVSDLAHILRINERKILFALYVLTDTTVAWIIATPPMDSPEIPGKSGALYKETEGKVIEDKDKPPPISPPKKKYLEYVFLTDEENKKLIGKLGEAKTTEFIERLNNYIGSKGKKYKSHYHTILNWSNRDAQKGNTANKRSAAGPDGQYIR